MKRERKVYDPAFKTKAVQLSEERTNISELAQELGIAVKLFYKWRKEYEEFGEVTFTGNGNLKLTSEQKQNPRIRKKLKDAELESDILKKASGIFSKSGRWNINSYKILNLYSRLKRCVLF